MAITLVGIYGVSGDTVVVPGALDADYMLAVAGSFYIDPDTFTIPGFTSISQQSASDGGGGSASAQAALGAPYVGGSYTVSASGPIYEFVIFVLKGVDLAAPISLPAVSTEDSQGSNFTLVLSGLTAIRSDSFLIASSWNWSTSFSIGEVDNGPWSETGNYTSEGNIFYRLAASGAVGDITMSRLSGDTGSAIGVVVNPKATATLNPNFFGLPSWE